MKKNLNKSLHAAKNSKKDEFYTQLSDIEKELKHYKDHFKGKVVLCNCDDPWVSNFFKYFSHNFEQLELKKLITTCYKNSQPEMFSEHKSDKAVWLEYTGDKDGDRVPSGMKAVIHRKSIASCYVETTTAENRENRDGTLWQHANCLASRRTCVL